MNASDKLKRLHEELGWPPYDRKVGELLLAVVEAAEWDPLAAVRDPSFANMTRASGQKLKRIRAALAALDSALSPPTGGSP